MPPNDEIAAPRKSKKHKERTPLSELPLDHPAHFFNMKSPEERKLASRKANQARLARQANQPYLLDSESALLCKYRKILQYVGEAAYDKQPWAIKLVYEIKKDYVKELKEKELAARQEERIKPPTIVIQNTINLPAPVHNQVPEPSLHPTQVIDLPNVTID